MDGFAVQFDHVHDLDGVVCILLSHELHKPIVLVQLCDVVTRHVHIHCTQDNVRVCISENVIQFILYLAILTNQVTVFEGNNGSYMLYIPWPAVHAYCKRLRAQESEELALLV